MNPFLLLLGLLGTSSIFKFGRQEKNDAADTPDTPVPDGSLLVDTSDDETDSPQDEPVTVPDVTAPTNDTVAPTEPVAPTLTPTTPSEPTPTVPAPTVTQPTAPVQSGGSGSDGADTTPIIADGTVSVMSGRVATLTPADSDIVDLKILSGTEHGNVTVNPDGTFALVMTQSEFTGSQSFTYQAEHQDGSFTTHQVGLNVTEGLQAQGWGTGESHYMLATDANDKVIVEHGEVHTKVYVSGSDSAYSLADIAQAEGLNVSNITGAWLADHGGYGQSEGMALAEDAGTALWDHVTPGNSQTSNWLLFENGYEYADFGGTLGPHKLLLNRFTEGESELNPLYIGTWGDGAPAEVASQFWQGYPSSNVVVQDIHFSGGIFILEAENVIFDHVTVSVDSAVMSSDSITYRHSQFIDSHHKEPTNGVSWDAYADRTGGLFMGDNEGVLVENTFFDLNGWSPEGQPASMFSHNMYFSANMDDVTVRDNIIMRGASYGAQIRSGGFIEDNVFLDNNAGVNALGGDYDGAGPTGNYTLMSDNLVTSGAHKTGDLIGGLTIGIYETGELTAMVDNIVAHLADPNNAAEQDAKAWAHDPAYTENTVYDDTIVYNWKGSHELHGDLHADQNTDGLNTSVLDQTTIQQFTAQLLGNSNATIADLSDYLRAQANGALDGVVDADLIIDFFQTGFGVKADLRPDAETLRFVPDELGDGVRWDNRLNWDTEDLPGLYAEDSVDLGGNDVVFGMNAEINTLDIGAGGSLNVYGGQLTANGGLTGDDGGTLNVEGAGQIWADGSNALDLDILMQGGRFVNTGDFAGADLTASGGQTILATDGATYEVSDGDTLAVNSGAAKVGFDGDEGGMAILDMQDGSTLEIGAEDGTLGTIGEFRSGAFGDEPDVQSGIDLGNAALTIDLSGLSAAAGTQFTLMDADEIVGLFDDASIGGLGARDATITIDYDTDNVTLELRAGNGNVSVETLGEEADVSSGSEALWAALTSDQGVVSNTANAMVADDEDDLLDVAA